MDIKSYNRVLLIIVVFFIVEVIPIKVYLYTESLRRVKKSGLGKAILHQQKALDLVNISYTTKFSKDYDILHINTYFFKSFILCLFSKLIGKKIVFHAHSTEEDYKDGFNFSKYTSKLFKWWLVNCYRLGDVLITPTEYSKKLLLSYKGLSNKKIYSLSNGIDLDFFNLNKSSNNGFRKKYDIKTGEKIIIGIGLYIRRKGIVDFVELAKRFPEYKFIWFGYSPLGVATKDVVDAVNTKLDNLLFAGYVEKEEIKNALLDCDLFVFPSLEETEGIPIIEACACKTKMIIRDIPVFDGWLENGKNVYKAKTIDEFEDKIRKILNNELPDLTEEAYLVAKERNLKIVGEKLKDIYLSIK